MRGKIISGPAAVLLIAFFFFPWIMVSCQGNVLGEMSGYQLAAGVAPESMAGLVTADDMQAEPILFAIPLAGLVALVLLAITLGKSSFEQNAAWGQIVAAVAAGFVLFMEWFQMRQHSDPMVTITPLPAFWGSLIALLALVVGAIIDLVLGQRRRASTTQATPVNLPKQSFPVQPDPRDFTSPPPAAQQTAVPQQSYPPSSSQKTIVDTGIANRAGPSQETIVDDSFGDSGQSAAIKTEVLHFKPDVTAKVVIEEGNNQGKQFSLYGDTTLGRVQGNSIVIDDTAMSSYHARIEEENGRYLLHDLGSTNGIYVQRAGQIHWEKQDKYELRDGDKIKLGRTTLLFNGLR